MTKIEEVARIIDPWAFSSPCGPGNALAREQAMAKARAAIEAMREPTFAMRAAVSFETAEEYPAMIDAILSEGE